MQPHTRFCIKQWHRGLSWAARLWIIHSSRTVCDAPVSWFLCRPSPCISRLILHVAAQCRIAETWAEHDRERFLPRIPIYEVCRLKISRTIPFVSRSQHFFLFSYLPAISHLSSWNTLKFIELKFYLQFKHLIFIYRVCHLLFPSRERTCSPSNVILLERVRARSRVL